MGTPQRGNSEPSPGVPDLDDIFAIVNERSAHRRRRAGVVAATTGAVAIVALGAGIINRDGRQQTVAASPITVDQDATTPLLDLLASQPASIDQLPDYAEFVNKGQERFSSETIDSLARLWQTNAPEAAAVLGLIPLADVNRLESFAILTDDKSAGIITFENSMLADDADELARLWNLVEENTVRTIAGNALTSDPALDRDLLFSTEFPDELAETWFERSYDLEQAALLASAWNLSTAWEAKLILIVSTDSPQPPDGLPLRLNELDISLRARADAIAAGWDDIAIGELSQRWDLPEEVVWIFVGVQSSTGNEPVQD